jgi:hypothetical protein
MFTDSSNSVVIQQQQATGTCLYISKRKEKIATHTLPGQLVTDNRMADSFSRHTHPTDDLFFESSVAGFH